MEFGTNTVCKIELNKQLEYFSWIIGTTKMVLANKTHIQIFSCFFNLILIKWNRKFGLRKFPVKIITTNVYYFKCGSFFCHDTCAYFHLVSCNNLQTVQIHSWANIVGCITIVEAWNRKCFHARICGQFDMPITRFSRFVIDLFSCLFFL